MSACDAPIGLRRFPDEQQFRRKPHETPVIAMSALTSGSGTERIL